jgi:type I pantothenate kinase
LRELIELIAARTERPTIVGLTGPVSVGKTTIAGEIASALRAEYSLLVSTVSTDGFLYPNAELEARGLAMRKGFPESFDADRLNRFLGEARDVGGPPLRAPVYDHLTYVVRVGEEVEVARADVLIVEGVNVLLDEHRDAYDVSVYVDAPDDAVVEWFCARLAQLFKEAADDPTSFYAPLAGWSDEQVRQFSLGAWDGINAINLEQYIRPTRKHATVVIEKSADHSIKRVIVR